MNWLEGAAIANGDERAIKLWATESPDRFDELFLF
jgi:hypothetical protein